MENKYYTELTIKTSLTDEDGVVKSYKYRKIMISGNDVNKIPEIVANRARDISKDEWDILKSRVQ